MAEKNSVLFPFELVAKELGLLGVSNRDPFDGATSSSSLLEEIVSAALVPTLLIVTLVRFVDAGRSVRLSL
jgi:hypothetical protein